MVGWLYKYLISKKTKSIETIKNWKNHTANAIIPQIKSANHTKIIVGFSYLHSWKKKSLSTQLYSTIFNFILLLQFSWKFTFILFFFLRKNLCTVATDVLKVPQPRYKSNQRDYWKFMEGIVMMLFCTTSDEYKNIVCECIKTVWLYRFFRCSIVKVGVHFRWR